ncbi:hypothetical protein [Aquimarina sp. 2201CG5-10]|uniref:hypothetical protein n=1 Tax=Aquimarina callyspongiae TaxID=3098150 RepID=UPI002AB5B639|nr:hypothetical protein [Aquimarina sp. 2201CG5-10]MDY8134730.1 hypothetical protein [Aquimarina sp. 2201CG5-10]
MKKIFRFFEFAYLAIMCFFIYQAYVEWGQEGNRSVLYLCFAGVAIFMYFFKRNFRKRFEANNKDQ